MLSRVTPIGRVVVVCVAVGAGYAFWELRREEAADMQAHVEQRQQSLQRMLDGALQSVRAGDWGAAHVQLSELMREDPTFQMARVIELKSAANREVAVTALLVEAQKAMDDGDLASAHQKLEAIAKDTAQGQRVDEKRAWLDRKAQERLEVARPLLIQTGDPEAMKKLLTLAEEVLAASPDQRNAVAYKDLATDALMRMDGRSHGDRRAEPPADVQARFIAGDLFGAREQARACSTKFKQCKTQLSQLLQFEKLYKRVESATPTQIESLVALSRKISGGPMTALLRARERSASDDYMVKASKLWGAGQPGPALAQANKALAIDPDNAGAKRLIAEAQAKAKELYLQSGGDGSPDDMVNRLQTIIEMTPATDEYHLKAMRQLAAVKK